MTEKVKIETIIGHVDAILLKQTYLKKEEGRYEYEIYAEYDDELSHEQKKELAASEDKKQTFYDSFEPFYYQCVDCELNNLLRLIEEHWDEEANGYFKAYEQDIFSYLDESIDFSFPYDHFLKQKLQINLVLDTGDRDYEYTLNNLAGYYGRDLEEIDESSSLLWLARQQGYTKEQLFEAVTEGVYNGSAFLKSVHTEAENTTTPTNALAFFIRMSVKDYIEWHDEKKNIVLSPDTPCGLYDRWQGAGGPLEIQLEKEVAIPFQLIDAQIEGTRGYGIDSIYGVISSFWKETIVHFEDSEQ